jgi:hypothetical protein
MGSWPLVLCLSLRGELVALLKDELSEFGLRVESWAVTELRSELSALKAQLAADRPAALVASLSYPYTEHLALLRRLAGPTIPLMLLSNATYSLPAGAGRGVTLLRPPYELSALCRAIRDAVSANE